MPKFTKSTLDIREISHKVGTTTGLLQTALVTTEKSLEDTRFFIEEGIKRLQEVSQQCNAALLGDEE